MQFRAGETVTIKSPIDVHAHLREPGGEDMETIESGTRAASAGGYSAVFDMPNNPNGMQTWTEERLDEKREIGQRTARTNIGFYAGADLADPSLAELARMYPKAAGFKQYYGHTQGNKREFTLEDGRSSIDIWVGTARRIGERLPILIHAREGVGEEVARYVASEGHPVHWCHVSTETEVDSCVDLTKEFPEVFTAGVTPHHMTMTGRDADFKYGWNGARMMPPLGNEVDHDKLLWAYNNGYIQILETDHAPHTQANKLRAEMENPEGNDDVNCVTCFGVSGIEFVLPVMMSLVQRNKITMERLVDSLHTQPARMLGLDTSGDRAHTTLTVAPYTIGEEDRVGRSSNNPYVGWTAWARVEEVVIDGLTSYSRFGDMSEFSPQLLRAGTKV